MSEVKISAEPRTEFGKGGARRTRRAGLVPAVLYGHGEKPQHIALPAREFAAAIRHGGLNQVFTIDIVGGTGTTLALPKAIQRDPIKDTFDHVDLIIVRRGEKVTVDVPVHLHGAAASETLVVTEQSTVQLEAEATAIPERIEIDIEGATVGTQILAGQLELPEGSTLLTDPETLVVNVTEQQSEEALEAELEEAEAEAGIEHDISDEEAAEAAEAAAEGEETGEGEAAESTESSDDES